MADRRPWPTANYLAKMTSGSCRELNIHSHTIHQTCMIFDQSLRTKMNNKSVGRKSPWLRWRSRRSLGWVPLKKGYVSFDGEHFIFRGVRYGTMHHRRELTAGITIAGGSFNADSKDRWYINVTVAVDKHIAGNKSAVGVDLGLKDLATLSDGNKIEARQFFKDSEARLANSQRRNKTKRTVSIHAKIANRRKDYLHKQSKKIADEYGLIVVGDVSPSRLSMSMMGKSVKNASWAALKKMISYKSLMNGGMMIEVPENYTTQTCSSCGCLPRGRPQGIAGLSKRVWTCDECDAVHDRDVNAAKNILRIGLDTLSGGTSHKRSSHKYAEVFSRPNLNPESDNGNQ